MSLALDAFSLDAVRIWFVEERVAAMRRIHPVAKVVLACIHAARIEGTQTVSRSQLLLRLPARDQGHLMAAVSYLQMFVDQRIWGNPISTLYENGPISIKVAAFQAVSAAVVDLQWERLHNRRVSALADVCKELCPASWPAARQQMRPLQPREPPPTRQDTSCHSTTGEPVPREAEPGVKRRRLLRATSSCSKEPLPTARGGLPRGDSIGRARSTTPPRAAASSAFGRDSLASRGELTPRKVEPAKRRRLLREVSLLKEPAPARRWKPGVLSEGFRRKVVDPGRPPDDERLSAAGAKVNGEGRLELKAYEDMKVRFASDADVQEHPDPLRPGMSQSECCGQHVANLQPWSDTKGRGWTVQRRLPSGKLEKRYMSAITWGSWRLAFLLARLQREVWIQKAAVEAEDVD